MQNNRYRMYRRGRGMYYAKDRITGKAESLGTANREQAQHLLAAKNQAANSFPFLSALIRGI